MNHEHKELLEHFLFFMVIAVLLIAVATAGDAEWVMKGDTINFDVGGEIHELTLVDVTENSCSFLINGKFKEFGKLSKHNVDGLLVHITDIEELPHTGLCKIVMPGEVVLDEPEPDADLQDDEFTEVAVARLVEDKQKEVIELVEEPEEKMPVKQEPVYIKEGVKITVWDQIKNWFAKVF
jgi:hypothetical protein